MYHLFDFKQQELEEDEPSYASANVPASKFPERHFCAVCGYPFVFQSKFVICPTLEFPGRYCQ